MLKSYYVLKAIRFVRTLGRPCSYMVVESNIYYNGTYFMLFILVITGNSIENKNI